MINQKTQKIRIMIKESIKEHNDIWKDISWRGRDIGYRCFDLTEEQIISIASGLVTRLKKEE